jgi:hypothetical protein
LTKIRAFSDLTDPYSLGRTAYLSLKDSTNTVHLIDPVAVMALRGYFRVDMKGCVELSVTIGISMAYEGTTVEGAFLVGIG